MRADDALITSRRSALSTLRRLPDGQLPARVGARPFASEVRKTLPRRHVRLDLNQCTIFAATYGLPDCLFHLMGPDSSGPRLRTGGAPSDDRTLSRKIHDMHCSRDPS